MNYKLNASVGDHFQHIAEKALNIASMENFKGDAVEFDFNGIVCLVKKSTNLGWLYRDYCNAHRMEWRVVGPNCQENYSAEVQAELEKRTKAAEEKAEQQQREYEAKGKAQREAFEAKTKGIEIELSDPKAWSEWRDKNSDPYGRCCFDYAESWAKLMQVEISKGRTIIQCAEETSFQLGFYGITGFMYGAAVSILSKCWRHGEELRKWHNKEYNHEGEGVVNPAVLTLSTPQ